MVHIMAASSLGKCQHAGLEMVHIMAASNFGKCQRFKRGPINENCCRLINESVSRRRHSSNCITLRLTICSHRPHLDLSQKQEVATQNRPHQTLLHAVDDIQHLNIGLHSVLTTARDSWRRPTMAETFQLPREKPQMIMIVHGWAYYTHRSK